MKAVLRYLGAKNRLAPWIVDYFPEHACYVEPFGGSAAVLLNKVPAAIEVYNDLYEEVVDFFKILRSGEADRLIEQVRLTPFSCREFVEARERAHTPLENARRLLVRSFMSVSTDGILRGHCGFRRCKAGGSSVTSKWAALPDLLDNAAMRFKNVQIECMDAIDCMRLYDSAETLHYVDPPYMADTRTTSGKYLHEYDDEQHKNLLRFLKTLKGKVVLSGYESDAYETELSGWHRVTTETETMKKQSRLECLWMNYQPQMLLFGPTKKGEHE